VIACLKDGRVVLRQNSCRVDRGVVVGAAKGRRRVNDLTDEFCALVASMQTTEPDGVSMSKMLADISVSLGGHTR
jgi:hypothetical protein